MAFRIREKLDIIKGVPNFVDMSRSEIASKMEDNGHRRALVMIKTKEYLFKNYKSYPVIDELLNNRKSNWHFIFMPMEYPLPFTYNKRGGEIIVNLSYFNVESIAMVATKDVYASVLGGLIMKEFYDRFHRVSFENVKSITYFIRSMFIRLFGKKYGISGIYMHKIPEFTFYLSVYLMDAFYGKRDIPYARQLSGFVPSDELFAELKSKKFDTLKEFLTFINKHDVFKGLSIFEFLTTNIKFFSINILPVYEDLIRFFTMIGISSINGQHIYPNFIQTYNQREFNHLETILESMYKTVDYNRYRKPKPSEYE